MNDVPRPRRSAHVVLMCGIAGAGKTTYAKELESRGYVRLPITDEILEAFVSGFEEPGGEGETVIEA